MKRGRVGNGSSKYDFDNGASLDADVAGHIAKEEKLKVDIIRQCMDADYTPKQIKFLFIEILSEIGGLEE